MKILINDSLENEERLIKIFQRGGYERNHLIFVHSFDECRTFFELQLSMGKIDIDLMVTNNNNDEGYNPFKATALLMLKNSLDESYSQGNFRISSIPVILYSSADNKTELQEAGFDAIVKRKEAFEHPYFIRVVEQLIKNWREKVIIDLENIGLSPKRFPYFRNDPEKQNYYNLHGRNYERTFFHRTIILSREFIAKPSYLDYDWLRYDHNFIEKAITGFRQTYLYHVKYDRQNNERTILHSYLKNNKLIMERDVFNNHLYETPLSQVNSTESQICDFILRPNLPEYQHTTFFEVKKEDVQMMVKKNVKRPQFSSPMHSHLYQIADYQSYSQSSENQAELKSKLGYHTNKFEYQLLVGRLEEKEEVKEVFEGMLKKHFSGIQVLTFEDFEELNNMYLKKFCRLQL